MNRLVACLIPAALLATACGAADDAAEDAARAADGLSGLPAVQLDHAFYRSSQLASDPGGYTRFAGHGEIFVEVENIAYQKQVIVHRSNGAEWGTENASYVASIGNNREIWMLAGAPTTYLPYFGGGQTTFAVEYQVAGKSYWDSNGGANYVVSSAGISTTGPEWLLGKATVRLDAATLAVSPTDAKKRLFAGGVVVENLGYAKTVTVRYSTDHWATSHDLPASFSSTIRSWMGVDSGGEYWSFSTAVPAGVPSVSFAVSYAVNGQTTWDNDFQQNYTVLAQ